MSTFSQNPDATPNPSFDEITSELVMPSAWQAMFDAAWEHLSAARPEGFDVEEIGRTAWSWLPDGDKPRAMDILFYTYWAAQMSDEAELERYEREKDARTELRFLLGRVDDLASSGQPTPYALLASIATLSHQLMGGAA